MKNKRRLDFILLVDDDEATNFVHELVIKSTGVQVPITLMRDAHKALLFLKEKFASAEQESGLLLLDINMPRMNGWEFLQEYKTITQENSDQLLVGMLTTSLNPDDKVVAHKIFGIDVFLNKPLTIVKFKEILDRHFTRLAS